MVLQLHMLPILGDNYTYFLVSGDDAVVIDPGAGQPVWDYLQQNKWQLTSILCTHHHSDHIAGNLDLKNKSGCKIYAALSDKHRIPEADHFLSEGDHVTVGNSRATVIETPGHTLHHISYYFPQDKKLFCGDTVFVAGCGRLFEGSPQQMLESFNKIAALPNDVEIYCGHEYTASNVRFALSIDGKNEALINFDKHVTVKRNNNEPTIPSTVGQEKQINPFMRCNDETIRRNLKMESATDAEVFGKIRGLKDNF
ncbi:hydroxyacylglutathione hydrolase [Candidatus Uabimicrobium sp. HlEnr_7]|uniref:hydroxyacylglutathione hydrolase n=1 Tax=Candidatus Uabimicrobium helgolandensis TaxID=3095367 RepID=UPI003555CCDA